MNLDLNLIRSQFPSLALTGQIHLDNPGGTQIASQSMDRIQNYFLHANANHGGAFKTSVDSDVILDEARLAMAEMLGAARPEEIIFGPNMTTLTLHLSRSLAHLLQPGDEIVLTRLDHDANVAPWLLIAEERECTVRFIDIHPETCTLDIDAFERDINPRTKIIAVGYASNAVGTINDVQRLVKLAHQVGAISFIDAVQYAAHGKIDVQALGCDFLACSAYKFFGPHWGILYGKYAWLDELTAYKVRTSSMLPPGKWETGTQSFEAIAGVLGAVEYIAWLGRTFGDSAATRREAVHSGFELMQPYEAELSCALIEGLQPIPGVKVYGITDLAQVAHRVSTVSFRMEEHAPREVATHLAAHHIAVWSGNFYALEVSRRLGVEDHGGLVRVGAVHYNTPQEIDSFLSAVRTLARE